MPKYIVRTMNYDLRTLGISSSSLVDGLFSATASQQTQLDYVANRALSAGIDLYTKKDYAGAVREFKRSIALSPASEYSDKAYEFIADAYLNQNNTAEAVKTYKQMIKSNPSNDSAHLSLGNLYFRAGQYNDAEAEYTMAVRTNPVSAENRYALGQTYLATNRYKEAETQFRRVAQMTPSDHDAYDALGQALLKLDRPDDAAVQFNKAIRLDRKDTDAYLGLGYAYADMKKLDEAGKQADLLSKLDKKKAADLNTYIENAADPKIKMVINNGGFPMTSGRDTILSTMDDRLAVPGGTRDYKISVMFSKDMDPGSVQNPNNWQISRATRSTPGGAYNLGLPVKSTEVLLPLHPVSVIYKACGMAEVSFRITQNYMGNGTLDPSHVVFKFMGKDVFGNSMDPTADEYSSVSKIV
jgi:tetratricopeptide (TPR) repeat protein